MISLAPIGGQLSCYGVLVNITIFAPLLSGKIQYKGSNLSVWLFEQSCNPSTCISPQMKTDEHRSVSLRCVTCVLVMDRYFGDMDDDVIKWKHYLRHWPFVRGIHRWPVDSPHKGQWRGALMFSLIYARTNDSANNLDIGDLRRYRTHYDVNVMWKRKMQAGFSNIKLLKFVVLYLR